MFKVAGVSTLNGKTKVRFANDMVSRVKMLNKGGHQDITLIELPTALSKGDIVKHLKTLSDFTSNPKFAEAIASADEKYNSSATVKVSKPNLENLKARAEAKTAELA